MLAVEYLALKEHELKVVKKKTKDSQREIATINTKKHATEIAIVNSKHKMIRDMEEFSRDLAATKLNISSTQESILGSIRDRLQATFENSVALKASKLLKEQKEPPLKVDKAQQHQNDQALLRDLAMSSVDDLLVALEQSEEKIFVIYNDVQSRSEELERLDLENKRLEEQLTERVCENFDTCSLECFSFFKRDFDRNYNLKNWKSKTTKCMKSSNFTLARSKNLLRNTTWNMLKIWKFCNPFLTVS